MVSRDGRYAGVTALAGAILLFGTAGCGSAWTAANRVSNNASSSLTETTGRLVFSTQPSSSLVSATITPAPTISVMSNNGDVMSASPVPVHVSLYEGSTGSVLQGTTTTETTDGVAIFPNLQAVAPGTTYTLVATSPGLAAATSVSFTVSQPAITVKLSSSSMALGSSESGSITLQQPAGSNGASITLSSSSSTIAIPSAAIAVAPGQSTAVFQIRAVIAGAAELTASATGYAAASPQSVLVDAASDGGPSVTTVQDLGTVTAAQAANGLGFNVDPNVSWEFQMAEAAGSTWVRFDCGWGGVEVQTPENTSGGYQLPSNCAQGLANSATYNQHPQVNALYGPPYQRLANPDVTADVTTGSYTIPTSAGSGDTLAQLAATCFDTQSKPRCEITLADNTQITNRWDYSGSLVSAIDVGSGTITLASATSIPIPAGTTLTINQLLYSPILLPVGGPFLSDPSTQAYVNYARYLAGQIAAYGISGDVDLYNEPNWIGGYWLHGQLLYDNPPAATLPTDDVNTGVALAVAAGNPIPGVQFMSNFTNVTGFASVLANLAMTTKYTTIPHLQEISSEAFHPYGNNPEDHFWSTACLLQNAATLPSVPSCSLVGGAPSSNFKSAVMYSFQPAAMGGIPHSISETGSAPQLPDVTARFDLRQYVGFQALGVTPILFFKMSYAGTLDWVDETNQQPYQDYTDFMSLMADFRSIAAPPITPAGAYLGPVVTSYLGYYPIDTATFIGAASSTDRVNSVLYFTWQQTYVTSGNWYQMTSPPAVPITITIPSGTTVAKVVDSVTLSAVSYTLSGTSLTYNVADNPIEVLLIPAAGPAMQTASATNTAVTLR
jgi:hypothetical protein